MQLNEKRYVALPRNIVYVYVYISFLNYPIIVRLAYDVILFVIPISVYLQLVFNRNPTQSTC